MIQEIYKGKPVTFYGLKITKKEDLTKNTFSIELEIPENLQEKFVFQAGQYISLIIKIDDQEIIKDYSIVSAPHEGTLRLGIKIGMPKSSSFLFYNNYHVGDMVFVSEPNGRFTLGSKPSEFRTILGFAAGIGITPIFSHFKNILHTEHRTRLFLFYGNKDSDSVAYREELDDLVKKYPNRLQIFYFYSQQKTDDPLFNGRLDEKRLKLIINQILHLDDTDEESTIWDAVDEVLICGKGEMIKSIANTCYENGIRKKNIHFELFEEFNNDIYPVEQEFPLIHNVQLNFRMLGKEYRTILLDNKEKILQQLLIQKFPVPYSCKSGICGSCICQLEEGEVELLENEYLTEKEEQSGKILACMSIAKTEHIKLNFDLFEDH